MLTVVSPYFPPQVGGSAILLANLFSSYRGALHAIAGYSEDQKIDPAFEVPCPTRYLPLVRHMPRLYARMRRRLPMLLCQSIKISIRRTIENLGTKAVMGTLPHDVYMVAAFLASRELRLPFYAHMHDLWIENTTPGTPLAQFASFWERVILTQSARVLCMTEAMQEHYEEKYGIHSYLLPHTIAERDMLRLPHAISPARAAAPTVLFVGAVSPPMNLDALKVLAAASELLPQGYDLLYCTSADKPSLDRLGIRSSRLRVLYLTREEVQRLESQANVLVAPLSHKNCSIDEVKTVFSTKLLEYMVSGRPILVFAPADSYHAQSAKKKGWGYVVSEDSPEALAAAIVRLGSDRALAEDLVQSAFREARNRNAARYAELLQQWVEEDTGGRRTASPRLFRRDNVSSSRELGRVNAYGRACFARLRFPRRTQNRKFCTDKPFSSK